MKQLHAQGQTGRYVGQIGRAQFHYTVADRPLMQQVWEEDLWPVRVPAATMQIRVCALSLVPRCGGHGSQGKAATTRCRHGRTARGR